HLGSGTLFPYYSFAGYHAYHYSNSGDTIHVLSTIPAIVGPPVKEISGFRWALATNLSAGTVELEEALALYGQYPYLTEKYRVSFDDHVNPFYRTSIHYPAYGSLSSISQFDKQPNNLGEINRTYYSDASTMPPPWHQAFTYTYRSDGY